MKKSFFIIALLLIPTSLFAVTQTMTITGKLQAPISIVQTTALTFGTIIHSASLASTITLNNSDVVNSNQPTDVITGAQTGVYTISGAPNTQVTASVGSTVNLTNSAGAAPNTFTTTLQPSSASSFNLSGSGTATFRVYGSIAIPVNAAIGDYTGSFVLTVIY